MESAQVMFVASFVGGAFGATCAHFIMMWRAKRRMMRGMAQRRKAAEKRLQKSRDKIAKMSKPPKRITKGKGR
jgi:hypothetical protein